MSKRQDFPLSFQVFFGTVIRIYAFLSLVDILVSGCGGRESLFNTPRSWTKYSFNFMGLLANVQMLGSCSLPGRGEPGFPVGGGVGGCQHTILPYFPIKLHQLRTFWAMRGERMDPPSYKKKTTKNQ